MQKDFVGCYIKLFSEIDSTNDYCRELLRKEDVREGTVIRAINQRKGRGLAGNVWESAKGKNLTFSIILHPWFLEPSAQFSLSMAVSLGISDFLKKQAGEVSVKWPNDILAGEKKIAGILIENSIMDNRLEYSVVGIGININQTYFPKHIPNPVSLRQLSGSVHSTDRCMNIVCREIDKWYSRLKKGGGEVVRAAYTEKLFRLNTESSFRNAGGEFTGIVRGVDNFGRLTLELANGKMKHYNLKEVEFVI